MPSDREQNAKKASVTSSVVIGAQAVPVIVEAEILRRLPSTQIIGLLPAPSARETIERVRSAFRAADLEWPRQRIVINIGPSAPLPGEPFRQLPQGSYAHLDLPIAITILIASGQLRPSAAAGLHYSGELSLSGAVRPVRGAVAMAQCDFGSFGAPQVDKLVMPRRSAALVYQVCDRPLVPVGSLQELVDWARGELIIECRSRQAIIEHTSPSPFTRDMSEVRGQEKAKRAMEITAVCGLGLLLEGNPGSGKTMLAARMSGILPDPTLHELGQTAAIHDAAGLLSDAAPHERPFRAPHHSISVAGMVGSHGGFRSLGEMSLAHNGVLFLDELPEFSRQVSEQLRFVKENRSADGTVTMTRAQGTQQLPAGFQVVAGANPCPCGFHGHSTRPCGCNHASRARYSQRLLDMANDVGIGMRVTVQPLSCEQMMKLPKGESSADIRERVTAARLRYDDMTTYWKCGDEFLLLLRKAGLEMGIDATGRQVLTDICRAIVALDKRETVNQEDLREAFELLSY